MNILLPITFHSQSSYSLAPNAIPLPAIFHPIWLIKYIMIKYIMCKTNFASKTFFIERSYKTLGYMRGKSKSKGHV